MKFEEKFQHIFPKNKGGWGVKGLMELFRNSIHLETPSVPKVVLLYGYCDYYGVHHQVTRGKPIPPPLIVFAPILIILTFPDANDRDLPSPNNNMNFPSFQWWWRHHSWNAYHAGVHYSWNFLSKMMMIRYGWKLGRRGKCFTLLEQFNICFCDSTHSKVLSTSTCCTNCKSHQL